MKLADLFENEDQWTKRSFARNSKGYQVSWKSESAVCRCISGAVLTAKPACLHRVFDCIRDAICEYRPGFCDDVHVTFADVEAIYEIYPDMHIIVEFNDHPDTTFADVKAVLKRADEIMEGESK